MTPADLAKIRAFDAACTWPESAMFGVTLDRRRCLEHIDAQAKEIERLREALRRLISDYVGLLETGRERIIWYGGQCDDVPTMERGDPALKRARNALAPSEAP